MAVKDDLRRFGARRYFEVEKTIAPIRVRDIGVNILMAIGTRESNLMNVLNEAGTDRGVFQITSIYHDDWLEDHQGCLSFKPGEYTIEKYREAFVPVPGKTANDEGYVPTLAGGAYMAYTILSNALFEARKNRLPQPVRFAVAAYNAGIGGAFKGLQDHKDVDAYTTLKNYSKDVLDVRLPQVRNAVAEFGWH